MNKWIAIGIISAMGILTIAVPLAQSHGKHHSPIKPAYDCYKNDTGPDTWGDVVLTHDLDLDVYTLWLCTCRHMDYIGWYCWWKKIREYQIRRKAIAKMREITGPNHGAEYLRSIRVSWFAFHNGDQCYIHHGKRVAVVVRKRG